MPDDWDPFHRFAVDAGPSLPVALTANVVVVVGAAAAAAGLGVVEFVAAVKVLDSLNTESQTLMHDENLELHDEKVPKT